ncbi:Sugar transporter STL1 [Fusarium agapanthi]|uniref:Sugar transporter STL1 n=1 Tax=Fusarium agapanthi TaxID=1803897 RepID=A0A9P5BLQ4_9HYPO|nr:Sugar transporter STL1 [Fusarium agapanthi]
MRTWFGHGKKLQRAVTSCCLCAFVPYGYDQGVFGGILENEDWLRQFNDPGDTLTGFITSSYNLGYDGLFGWPWAGSFVGAALQATAFTRGHLIVGRIVTGVGTGIKTSTVQIQEAIEVLSAAYDKPIDHPDILREVESIEAALSIEAEAEGSTSWASTFRKDKASTRYRVFLAWVVQFMNQAGGINLVVYDILSKPFILLQ